MAEYIEKEKALNNQRWNGRLDEYVVFVRDIESIPAADVAPVVRCKDCQNSYEWANVDGDNYRYCGYLRDRWNHDYDRMVDDDDFCKWGRRRVEA